MTNNENRTQAVREHLSKLAAIKAPTKRMAYISAALIAIPTQAEVGDFTAELRRRAGVQDVTLLPDTTWTVRRWENGNLVGAADVPADLAHALWNGAERIVIDWPSVTFHWGISVTFEKNGHAFVAQSSDYQMTETYLSS